MPAGEPIPTVPSSGQLPRLYGERSGGDDQRHLLGRVGSLRVFAPIFVDPHACRRVSPGAHSQPTAVRVRIGHGRPYHEIRTADRAWIWNIKMSIIPPPDNLFGDQGCERDLYG